MKLQDLKRFITENILSDDFIIMQCEDDTYIANQYVDTICENKNLHKVYIDTLHNVVDESLSDLFADSDSYALRVLSVETFSENLPSYFDFTNTVVICNKIDKAILKKVEPFIVKFPKVQDWALKEYMKVYCSNISDENIDSLYANAAGNTSRIINELDKVLLFEPENRNYVLSELLNDKNSDMFTKNIFDLKNALITRDMTAIKSILNRKNCVKSDVFNPLSLTAILLSTFRNGLFAKYAWKNAKQDEIARKLDIKNPKQLYWINKECSMFPPESLQDYIAFLSKIDLKLKSGELELTDDQLLSYIVINILS